MTRAQAIVYSLLEGDSLDSLEGEDFHPFHTYPKREEPMLPIDRVKHWNRFYAGTGEVRRRFDRLLKRRTTIANQNYAQALHAHGQVKPGEGI